MAQVTKGAFRDDTRAQTTLHYVSLMTVAHPLITTLHLCDDPDGLTSNGTAFIGYPMRFAPIGQSDTSPPHIEIEVTTVDQSVIKALREVRGDRTNTIFTLSMVTRENPDDYIVVPGDFTFQGAQTNGRDSVKIDVGFMFGALNDSFPVGRFSQANSYTA